jgi:hypothetical protein
MGKNWSELSPDEKREERFKRWLSPEDINFISVFKVFSKVGELEKQWRNVIAKVERKGREMGIPPLTM